MINIPANRYKSAFFFAIISTLVINIICLYRPIWQPFEKKVYDLKHTLAISFRRVENIVVIDIDAHSLKKLGRYQNWPRAYFAEIIDYLRDAKVVGLDILFAEPDTLPTYTRQYYLKPSFDSLLMKAIENNKNLVLVSSIGEPTIFAEFTKTGIGEIIPDRDGVVRRGFYKWFGQKTFAATISELATKEITKKNFLIYFLADDSFRRISFADVYLKRVPREYFADKIALIGGSAPGLFDFHSVPFKRNFPGILIQANLINNFINNLKIVEIPYYYVILLTFIICILTAIFTLKKSSRFYLIAYFLIYLLFIITNFILFGRNLECGIVRPTYAFILTIITTLIYRYRFEEQEKRKIKAIFSRYYSRELVEKVITKPPRLGGEKVDCTIIFADIRNFTPYAEKASPKEVARRLNSFLTTMVNVVFKYEGRVDKFIGDCIMAVFGSPVQLRNHALNACLAATEMITQAERLGFKIGVGINSGEVIIGNFGSPMRMEYTVIGDAVNLASRLEGLTKEYNCNIIVGEATYRQIVREKILDLRFQELGKLRVKGKEEEITAYRLNRA